MTEPRPTYAELKAQGAREFLTDGPNSGGVAGLLVTSTHVWWFQADWTPEIMGRPTPVAEFVRGNRDNDGRGVRDAVAWLLSLGIGADDA